MEKHSNSSEMRIDDPRLEITSANVSSFVRIHRVEPPYIKGEKRNISSRLGAFE